jgi:hypothetical protein
MIEILSERPWIILCAGLFVAAVLFFVWTQVHRMAVLWAVVTALVVTGLLIAVERLWVTDREALVATLYQIADDVRQDNWPAVLEHIHPDAVEIRQIAETEYNHYQLTDARITRVWEVTIHSDRSPPEATAKFTVIVTGGPRAAQIANESVARFLIVQFRKDRGRWKVFSYSHYPPYDAFRRSPTE